MTTSGRKIQLRHGSSTDIPILDIGEPAFTTDNKKLYIGSNSGNVLIDTSLDNIPNATTTVKGLMSPADKVKLNNIDTNKIGTVKSVNGVLPNTSGDLTIAIPNETVITNNLTSTSTVNALSANQGKVLNDKITQINSNGGYSLPNATSSVLGGVKVGTNISVSNGTISVSDANTTTKGLVQLNNTVTSTSTTLAATANSVKIAYDKAVEAMTSGGGSSPSGDVSVNYLQVGTRESSVSVNRPSMRMGTNIAVVGVNSVGTGNLSNASGESSFATGESTIAEQKCTFASGYGSWANLAYSTAMGYNNKALTGDRTSFNVTNDAFVIGAGASSKANAFRIKFDGSVYGKSAFNSSGADYAEYFEWLDGNGENEDRVGYIVTLNGDKLEKAKDDSYLLGVVSANPSVIGDSYQDDWNGRYEVDLWGRNIKEEYTYEDEVTQDDGSTLLVTRKGVRFKENDKFDSEAHYVPREDRKEWSPVGLVGKLLVRDDGTSELNGYVKVGKVEGTATKSEEITNMRVMERINENIIRVFIK